MTNAFFNPAVLLKALSMRTLLLVTAITCAVGNAVAEDDLATLQRKVRDRPKSAEAHVALAQAYHWRKDFPSAAREYRAAANLDSRYVWAVIPLLDEYGKWDDIIALAGRRQARILPSSILGALVSAYHEKGQDVQAGRIVEELEYRSRVSKEDDYCHYVLAYVYLWSDDSKKATEQLRMIKDPAMLRYARTSPKFKKLSRNATFLALTAGKKK